MRFCRNIPAALGVIVLPQLPFALRPVATYWAPPGVEQKQSEFVAVSDPRAGSSNVQKGAAVVQLFHRIACCAIEALLCAVLVRGATDVEPGPTIVKQRPGGN